jgi:hypothetical protein
LSINATGSEPALENPVVGQFRKTQRSCRGDSGLGEKTNELARPDLDAATGREVSHTIDDLHKWCRIDVDHIQRYLNAPARRQQQTQSLNAAHPAARFPHRGCDGVCVIEASVCEVDIERDQERPRADEDAARPGIEA